MTIVARTGLRRMCDPVEVVWTEARGQLRRASLPQEALKLSTESAAS